MYTEHATNLANFLRNTVEGGSVVVVSVFDTASNYCVGDCMQALSEIGADVSNVGFRGNLERYSHYIYKPCLCYGKIPFCTEMLDKTV